MEIRSKYHSSWLAINAILFKRVSIAPLIVFRIVFGGLMFFSSIRFIQKGWISQLYVQPEFHFQFIDSLPVLGELGMYLVFFLLAFSSLAILFGFFFRANSLLFFLLFTYVELLDKTYYLNHYYLVSILSFWLLLSPANRMYAVDTKFFPWIKSSTCSNWSILVLKVQLSFVYFFAGLAKVNSDWLLNAQPLFSWLPGKYEIPILGRIVHLKETAFLFSWVSCIYDLFIWVFLIKNKTRVIAYGLVIVFHLLTAILFPNIGMFPIIMMSSTIVFFSSKWHLSILNNLPFFKLHKPGHFSNSKGPFIATFLLFYLLIQLYLPLRHWQYDGNLFWTEEGYRFSWRVMLMEKNGFTSIIIKDPVLNSQKELSLNEYLSPFQIQQMKSQPDMIYQFAQHIGAQFEARKGYAPKVFVKSRMSLNGRPSQEFLNSNLNIYKSKNFAFHDWIIPLKKK